MAALCGVLLCCPRSSHLCGLPSANLNQTRAAVYSCSSRHLLQGSPHCRQCLLRYALDPSGREAASLDENAGLRHFKLLAAFRTPHRWSTNLPKLGPVSRDGSLISGGDPSSAFSPPNRLAVGYWTVFIGQAFVYPRMCPSTPVSVDGVPICGSCSQSAPGVLDGHNSFVIFS